MSARIQRQTPPPPPSHPPPPLFSPGYQRRTLQEITSLENRVMLIVFDFLKSEEVEGISYCLSSGDRSYMLEGRHFRDALFAFADGLAQKNKLSPERCISFSHDRNALSNWFIREQMPQISLEKLRRVLLASKALQERASSNLGILAQQRIAYIPRSDDLSVVLNTYFVRAHVKAVEERAQAAPERELRIALVAHGVLPQEIPPSLSTDIDQIVQQTECPKRVRNIRDEYCLRAFDQGNLKAVHLCTSHFTPDFIDRGLKRAEQHGQQTVLDSLAPDPQPFHVGEGPAPTYTELFYAAENGNLPLVQEHIKKPITKEVLLKVFSLAAQHRQRAVIHHLLSLEREEEPEKSEEVIPQYQLPDGQLRIRFSTEHLNIALQWAANNNDVLLLRSVCPRIKFEYPLHHAFAVAAQEGHFEAVQFILTTGRIRSNYFHQTGAHLQETGRSAIFDRIKKLETSKMLTIKHVEAYVVTKLIRHTQGQRFTWNNIPTEKENQETDSP